MSLPPGTTLGPYTIDRPLGAGGMGEVYRARDTRLGRDVAIKILPRELMSTPEARTRLEREARAVASVSHPNVCTIYDVGREGETSYLVLELVEGSTLRELLAKGPLPIDTLLALAVEIVDALAAAHEKGITHRDLKPGNVMVTSRGQAKLMDFGLATGAPADPGGGSPHDLTLTESSGRLTSSGSTVGTVAYMSPEQARGDRVDARSDLFSFGTLLYESATGRLPFPGTTSAVVFDGILNRAPAPLRERRTEVPPELERIVLKALEKDRDLRYQTAAELRADLKRLKRDLDSAKIATGSSAAESAVATSSRPGRGRWLIAAGALVVTLVPALLWLRGNVLRSAAGGPWSARQLELPALASDAGECAISPDGRRLVYLLPKTISVDSLDTSDSRVVDDHPPPRGDYYSSAWNADGSRIVSTWCDSLGNAILGWLSPDTGQPKALASLGRLNRGERNDLRAALSPDGTLIAVRRDYVAQSGGFLSLALRNVGAGSERTLARAEAGEEFFPAVWSPSGRRLAVLAVGSDRKHARIETIDLAGGRTTVLADSNGALIPTFAAFRTIVWLADGRMLFTKRPAVRGQLGDAELWTIRVDPKTGRRSGEPAFVYSLPGAAIHSPSASRDARRVCFSASRTIRGVALVDQRGEPRRIAPALQGQLSAIAYPVWSADGNALFVRSMKVAGDWSLGRIRLRDGQYESLARFESTYDRPLCLSPDGKDLYCMLGPNLVARPVSGGAPRTLAKTFTGTLCPAARSGRWLVVEYSGDEVVAREFDEKSGPGAERFRYPVEVRNSSVEPVAALSSDGGELALLVDGVSHIVILDASAGRKLRDIEMPQQTFVQYLWWSNRSPTLFASGMNVFSTYWIARLGNHGVDRVIVRSETAWPSGGRMSPDDSTIAYGTVEFRPESWLLEAK